MERQRKGHYSGSIDELFDVHSAAVLAYARRRTLNVADAEDVVAETFVVAWRRRSETPAEPRPWLFAIARRVLANQRRSAERRASLVRRMLSLAAPMHSAPATGGEPALDALAELSLDDQELLKLVAWDELTHAEIAEVLGISVNAVTVRLYRAKQRFASHFELKGTAQVKDSIPSRTRIDQWTELPKPASKEATQ